MKNEWKKERTNRKTKEKKIAVRKIKTKKNCTQEETKERLNGSK